MSQVKGKDLPGRSTPPPPLRQTPRLDPATFQLPVERMREGYYSDKYFVRTREVLVASGRDPRVTVQLFQKQPACLGGVDEALAILKTCLTTGFRWEDLEVHALYDKNTSMRPEPLRIPPLDELQKEVLANLLNPERGLPPDARADLRAKLGMEPEPAAPAGGTNAVPEKVSSN